MFDVLKATILSVGLLLSGQVVSAQSLSAEAEIALDGLGFAADSSGIITYGEAVEMDGSIVLKDVFYTEAPQISAGEVVLAGLTFDASGASFSAITISNYQLGDLKEYDFLVSIDSIELQEPNNVLRDELFSSVLLSDFETIDAGNWSLSGASLRGVNISSRYDDIFDLALAEMTIAGIGEGITDRFLVAGLDFNYPLGGGTSLDITLEKLDVTGINQTLFDAFQLGWIEEGLSRSDKQIARLRDRQAADLLEPGYDSIELSDLKADLAGVLLDLPRLYSGVQRDDEGRSIRAWFEKFDVAVTLDKTQELGATAASAFTSLGISDGTIISGQFDSLFLPDENRSYAVPESNYIAAQGLMRIGFGLDFSDGNKLYRLLMDMSDYQGASIPRESAIRKALADFVVSNATLVMEDYGLVDGLLTLYAQDAGFDMEFARSQAKGAVALLPLLASELDLDPIMLNRLSVALSGYLEGNSQMIIGIAPNPAMTGPEFMDLENLTDDRLGFIAKTISNSDEANPTR